MKKYLLPLAIAFTVLLNTSCSKETVINFQDDSAYEIGSIEAEAGADNQVDIEKAILELTNEHRLAMNSNTLSFSPAAYEEANKHTDYMISKGKLSHDKFQERAYKISTKVKVKQVAENVARHYDTAQEAFEHWLGSPDHRRSIEGNYTHTAISVKVDKNGKFYFTQLFYR
ncbi:CAP domain-containing protein [Zeaxanthinibacter enoshimensis]|uniref:Cysteine-rich secretory protein family protein n=1 Tax=Zeaxanthinibacter enoshimensis TaxID=392009 RepID=A0A4R6TRK9_9FLAO|nr:CAP domain-containing protein [Zeaxanthinibacter enoshimensis]TDQ32957.1 Cysteine-rich secretory protein family protein [Zeaxanthinibacter enoshimensis]